MTWTRPVAGGLSDKIAVPILPPSCASMPADATRCASSAVVVDLPLVPVMATKGESGATARRSRQNSSILDHEVVAGHRDKDRGVARSEHIVVIGDDIGAAGKKRACARKPGAAQPEHGDLLSRKGRDRDHAKLPQLQGRQSRQREHD